MADNLTAIMEIGDAIEGLEENLVRPDRRFVHEGAAKLFLPNVRDTFQDCSGQHSLT